MWHLLFLRKPHFYNSLLQALDIFSDLITASVDYAQARLNDDFMPGQSISPVLNIAKLQKIKVIVDRIKSKQIWK
jgi:hypothetical protein